MTEDSSPKTLRDLENQICELRSMAAIADHLLDDIFGEALASNPKTDDGHQPIVFTIWRDDIDKLSFAYKRVMCMAGDLKRDFYVAYDAS